MNLSRFLLFALLWAVPQGPFLQAGQPITPVAVSSQEAPGTGAAFDYFQEFVGSPGINDAGQAQFIAHLIGIGVNSTNDTAVFAGVPGVLQLVAREGSPAPGLPGRIYAEGLFVNGLNASGEVLLYSSLDDGKIAFFTGLPNAITLLAKIGDVIPGAPGPIDQLDLAAIGYSQSALLDSGKAAFGATFDQINPFSLVLGSPGALAIVAQPGMQAPDRPPGITLTYVDYANARLGNGDLVIFDANDSASDFSRGVYIGTIGDIALLAHSGEQAAGTEPGVAYDESSSVLALNSAGTAAFGGFLTGVGINNTNWNGLWVGLPGALSLAARGGMQAPGVEQGVKYAGVVPDYGFGAGFGPVINSSGQIAFTQFLTTGQQAMWAGPPEDLRLVAREGLMAPGLAPGETLGGAGNQTGVPFSYTYYINNEDRAAFSVQIGTRAYNGDFAIYVGNPDGELVYVTRYGDPVQLADGRIVTISGLYPTVNGLNSNGQLLIHAGLSDGSDAILLADTAATVITSASTASGKVGTSFAFQLTASNSPTSFSASNNLPPGLSLNNSTGVISGTPTTTGTFPVSVSATNEAGQGPTSTLTITVAALQPPVITSPGSANGTVGQPFSYQITATNSPTSFGATGLPSGLTVNASTGRISGTPSVAGVSSVNLSATNAGGTGTKVLTLTISATSSAPVITSPRSAAGMVGQLFSYQITATNSPTSFGASGLPGGLTINTGTGLISGTPSVAGGFSVNLSATNSSGTGTAVLTLTISPAAAPPVITSPGTASGGVGQFFAYQITATNSPTSFGASGLPTGLTVNASTGIISGTPSAAGDFTIGLSATNGVGTGTADLALHIDPAGAPPVITSPLTATATIGQQFIYQILATNRPTSFTATNLPTGLVFDSALGVISGQATTAGSKQVALGATNAGGTGKATLTLTVQAATSGITILSGPATGRTGEAFNYQIRATGITSSAIFSATGLPAGLSIESDTGAISGTTSLPGVFEVHLTVSDSGGAASVTVAFTFSSDPALPVITSADVVTLPPGEAFSYTITAPNSADPATDPTTFSVIGELPPGLIFDRATGTISGTYTPLARKAVKAPAGNGASVPSKAVIGTVQLVATNSHGTATQTLVFLQAVPQLLNISTRMQVLGGDNVLIGGFIITGTAPKKVILRAIGPSLANANPPVAGALPDPILELHKPDGTVITNDNWKDTQKAEIITTAIAPTNEKESAIVATLAPGAYTAIVRGKNGGTGIGLVEAYDFDQAADSTLANISTRGFVDTGDNVMIGGVIIGGGTSQVLVRAIGPSLSNANPPVPGALADTTLELHDKDGAIIGFNDDWRDSQQVEIEATQTEPKSAKESAIVAFLTPGNYTAIVRGKDNTTGVALVEVYNITP